MDTSPATATDWDDEPITGPLDPTRAAHRLELRRLVQLERDGIIKLADFPNCRSCLANLDTGGHFRGCGNSGRYVNEPRTIGWPGAGQMLGFVVEQDDADQRVWGMWARSADTTGWTFYTDATSEEGGWIEADDYATNNLLALFHLMGANRRDWTE